MTKSVLNQRTTSLLLNVSRCRQKQTTNTRTSLLFYLFASSKANKTTVKANVTSSLG